MADASEEDMDDVRTSVGRTLTVAVEPCPKCGAARNSPAVCLSCGAIFPVSSGTDPFALLGLPRSFALDEPVLHSAYRALSRAVHPDRFAQQGADAVARAMRVSAAVNEAHDVLRDPLRRADYLLTLAGGPSALEERGVPGDLLAEVMTRREAIDAAREGGDRATLEQIHGEVARQREAALAEVARLAGFLPGASLAQRQELRRRLNSMKYYDNLLAWTQEDVPTSAL